MKVAFLAVASFLILQVSTQCNQCSDPINSLPVWTDIASKWQCEGIKSFFPDEKCRDSVQIFCSRRHDLGGDLYQMFFRDSPNIIGIDPEHWKRTRQNQLQTTLYCRNSTWRLEDPTLPPINHLLCDQFIINETLWKEEYIEDERTTTVMETQTSTTEEMKAVDIAPSTTETTSTTESLTTSEDEKESTDSDIKETEENISTTEETEATTEEVDATTEEAEATTEEADATTEEAEATTEEADATTEEAEATTEQAEATTEQAEATTEEADATTEVVATSSDFETTEIPKGEKYPKDIKESKESVIDEVTEEPVLGTTEMTTRLTTTTEFKTTQSVISSTITPKDIVQHTMTDTPIDIKSESSELETSSTIEILSSRGPITTEMGTTTEVTTRRLEPSLQLPITKRKEPMHDAVIIESTEGSLLQTQLRPPTSAVEYLILPAGVMVDNSTILSDAPKNTGGFIDPPRGFILNEKKQPTTSSREISKGKKGQLLKRRKPLLKSRARNPIKKKGMRKRGRNAKRLKQTARRRRNRNPSRKASKQLKWKKKKSTPKMKTSSENLIY